MLHIIYTNDVILNLKLKLSTVFFDYIKLGIIIYPKEYYAKDNYVH